MAAPRTRGGHSIRDVGHTREGPTTKRGANVSTAFVSACLIRIGRHQPRRESIFGARGIAVTRPPCGTVTSHPASQWRACERHEEIGRISRGRRRSRPGRTWSRDPPMTQHHDVPRSSLRNDGRCRCRRHGYRRRGAGSAGLSVDRDAGIEGREPQMARLGVRLGFSQGCQASLAVDAQS